jgi:hypothetical protein
MQLQKRSKGRPDGAGDAIRRVQKSMQIYAANGGVAFAQNFGKKWLFALLVVCRLNRGGQC